MKEKILIVDDDIFFAKEIEAYLKKNYSIESVFSYEHFFKKFIPYFFDLVLLDLKLGDKESDKEKGVNILKHIKEISPPTTVLMLTNFPDVDSAVRCIKLGASDYLRKEKVDEELLKKTIFSALERDSLKRKLHSLETQIKLENPWEMVGNSRAILQVKESIKIAADDGIIDVLITGESGTGKELVARSIHHLGKRKNAPFLSLNLTIYPKDILYTQIFGHEKGSFTGASEKKVGAFETAHKGIAFLDEIGEASHEVQISLLRFLETREFQRLGSTRSTKVDIQILLATNKNLKKEVEKEQFREDLFYRINRFEIYLPPLRKRKEDIEILTHYFLKCFGKTGRSKVEKVEKEVMDAFMSYSWPGNIRELKNIVESAVIKSKTDTINLSHISLPMVTNPVENEGSFDFKKKMLEKEMQEIEQALRQTNFRKGDTAKLIGCDRSHLTRKIKRVFQENPDFFEKFELIRKSYFKA
ncbi:MAG: sigma-54 dependent transcriptional regulator [Candidatus Aminicenantes bacterium]